jgi:predicted ATP-dependent protease
VGATVLEVGTVSGAEELGPSQLRRRSDPGQFTFRTTAELPDTSLVLGQDRAVAAIRFGIGVRRKGYNLFALGAPGTGKHMVVQRLLEEVAASEPDTCDWCYVHNFEQPHRPSALALPRGQGVKLRADMARLVEDLRTTVSMALETEQYRSRHEQIHEEFNERREQALAALRERAAHGGVALIQAPVGFALAPMHAGQVIDQETFERLPEEQRQRIRGTIKELEEDLEKLLREIPKWQRESREKIRELKRAVTSAAVDVLIEELKRDYDGQPGVQAYLEAVEKDVIENAEDFRRTKDGEDVGPLEALIARSMPAQSSLRRYQVNVLEDGTRRPGAPVIYEDKPTFQNLVGRIEHVAQMGTLITDFTLIKPGALHRSNGGYLILDARRLLVEPFAWEGLKRALRARELKIESLGEALSLVSTVSLEPEPVPLNVKVVLIGDRSIYYLLYEFDPDFKDLFKVAADFDDTIDREAHDDLAYPRLIATIARRESLRPLSGAAVAHVIDRGSRVAGDSAKLSVGLSVLADLLREADHWASVAGREVIDAEDVERAIEAQIYRAARPRERLQEEIERGTIMIATGGEAVGQVNGLSVIELGGFAFGRPSRITARVRLGSGTVVDIEREVELGGPVHSKGVLILSGFLAGRYVPDQPLSLSASLVFEQSYGPVEGDSASSAELYSLLSALAEAPVKQSMAVTGSVNQRGEVQAVGGVNEKIEGFFDVCRARGLEGQGVLIPAANKRHLMLREDVVQAVASGKFHIYAIENIDQGLELLTGIPAGARDETGQFPAGSLNSRVEQRLMSFAAQARAFKTGSGESSLKSQV